MMTEYQISVVVVIGKEFVPLFKYVELPIFPSIGHAICLSPDGKDRVVVDEIILVAGNPNPIIMLKKSLYSEDDKIVAAMDWYVKRGFQRAIDMKKEMGDQS